MRAAVFLALTLMVAGGGGCAGHGEHTQEALDRANENMAHMRAAADYDIARQQFRSGDLKTALATIDRVVAADPEVPHGHSLRGRILLEYSRNDEALAAFDTAIAIDDQEVETHYHRGIALERLGRLDDAREAYLASATLDPSSHEAILAVAEILIEQGDDAGARALLESREEYRWVAGFRQTLGHVAMMRGDVDQAIHLFGEAVTLDPKDPSFREDLMRAQLVGGKYLDAESNLRLLRGDEELAKRRDLMHLHAACLLELDQPVEARTILYDLTREDAGRNDIAAWRRLADVAMVLDDEALLHRVARRLMAIAPAEPHGYVTLALWQRKQGDVDGAIKSVRQARERATGADLDVVSQLEQMLVAQRGA